MSEPQCPTLRANKRVFWGSKLTFSNTFFSCASLNSRIDVEFTSVIYRYWPLISLLRRSADLLIAQVRYILILT